MAKKVPISVSLLDMQVVIATSVEGEDKDTALKTVCVGGLDGKPTHDAVRTNQVMRCPHCEVEKSSHWGFPKKAREEADGSLKLPTTEELEAAKPGPEITGRIALTGYPADQVETTTVRQGRIYYALPDKTAIKQYAAVREGLRQEAADGWVYLTEYAPATAAATFIVGVSGDLITLTEVARPEQVKIRPTVNVPDASPADVALFRAMAATVRSDTFDQSSFPDKRKAVIAAALEAATPVFADENAEAVLPATTAAEESAFAKAYAALAATGVTLAAVPELASKKAPRKRAPRKAAAKAPAA